MMKVNVAAGAVCLGSVIVFCGGTATAQPTSMEGTTETSVEVAASEDAAASTGESDAVEESDAAGEADAAPVTPPRGEHAFNLKLRNIEERVNELKEKIFQSKARLIQLQEVVLHGAISGAKAVLVHRNEMGSSFRLRRVQYALDGAPIFHRVDTSGGGGGGGGELNNQGEIEIFNGSIAPGSHQISVYLEYQGYGYGIFSYLNGYKFKIKSSYTFNAEEGKLTTVTIVGYEKGGITTALKDRPSVRYDVESSRALRQGTVGEEAAAEDQTGAPE